VITAGFSTEAGDVADDLLKANYDVVKVSSSRLSSIRRIA